jgi:hypothetical protein
LAGIIISLLLVGGYGDIALRDFGLLLGALTLFRLAGADSANSNDGGTVAAVDRGAVDSTNGRATESRDRRTVA